MYSSSKRWPKGRLFWVSVSALLTPRRLKRAKYSLRIRSIRAGFGPNGGWRWELPCDRDGASTAPPITREPVRAERSVPVDWVEGLPVSTIIVRQLTSHGTDGISS